MLKKTNLLYNVVKKSLVAALAGLSSGLVFGLLIWGITHLFPESSNNMPPIQIAAFLGMGAGTAIGAILGGVAGLKG